MGVVSLLQNYNEVDTALIISIPQRTKQEEIRGHPEASQGFSRIG